MKSSRFKVILKKSIRWFKDIVSLQYFKFATQRKTATQFSHLLELSLPIFPSEQFENKHYNITKTCDKIHGIIVQPKQIFSFWHSADFCETDFKKSRVIRNGKTVEEFGGGMCQVSGILYYMSLLAGLKIVERHNHSVDIYTEKTRFTPLGTDATVVFGYKDLRIKNNYSFPIQFLFVVKENEITLQLFSKEKIEKNELQFDCTIENNLKIVHVKNQNQKNIGLSVYKM